MSHRPQGADCPGCAVLDYFGDGPLGLGLTADPWKFDELLCAERRTQLRHQAQQIRQTMDGVIADTKTRYYQAEPEDTVNSEVDNGNRATVTPHVYPVYLTRDENDRPDGSRSTRVGGHSISCTGTAGRSARSTPRTSAATSWSATRPTAGRSPPLRQAPPVTRWTPATGRRDCRASRWTRCASCITARPSRRSPADLWHGSERRAKSTAYCLVTRPSAGCTYAAWRNALALCWNSCTSGVSSYGPSFLDRSRTVSTQRDELTVPARPTTFVARAAAASTSPR